MFPRPFWGCVNVSVRDVSTSQLRHESNILSFPHPFIWEIELNRRLYVRDAFTSWARLMIWQEASRGILGPISHKLFLHHNLNSMKLSSLSYPSYSWVIAMKFCTWHDTCGIVAYTIFCNSMIPLKGVTLKTNFPTNLNSDGKIIFEMSPKAVKLPWIFPGAPLIFNGAPRNMQGNHDRYRHPTTSPWITGFLLRVVYIFSLYVLHTILCYIRVCYK